MKAVTGFAGSQDDRLPFLKRSRCALIPGVQAVFRPNEEKLGKKSDFTLVPDRENSDLIAGHHKSIQGHVAGVAIGNDQFA